jgi:hypothetical protein
MYTIAGRVVEEPGDWILKEIDIAAEMGAAYAQLPFVDSGAVAAVVRANAPSRR